MLLKQSPLIVAERGVRVKVGIDGFERRHGSALIADAPEASNQQVPNAAGRLLDVSRAQERAMGAVHGALHEVGRELAPSLQLITRVLLTRLSLNECHPHWERRRSVRTRSEQVGAGHSS